MHKYLCYTVIVCLTIWMNSYPGSIHMWLACTHPMKSCCLCSGHNLSTPWPHSHTHNVSVHVLSKPWVRLWWCSHLHCCLSGPQFYWKASRKERKLLLEILMAKIWYDHFGLFSWRTDRSKCQVFVNFQLQSIDELPKIHRPTVVTIRQKKITTK